MIYQKLRIALSLLLLLGLCLQAAIPAGFMPGQAEDGTFEIVICTPAGVETITVDAEHAPVPDHPEKENPQNCAFAPVLAQGLSEPPAIPAAPAFIRPAHAHLPTTHSITATAIKPWGAQGPPRSA